jgi:hypothetical protein
VSLCWASHFLSFCCVPLCRVSLRRMSWRPYLLLKIHFISDIFQTSIFIYFTTNKEPAP